MEPEIISHQGIITDIERDVIKVSILVESACAACHAKGFCTIADQKEKVIEARNTKKITFTKGEKVSVIMRKSLGLKAVLFGYFLPFLILIITLLTAYQVSNDEAFSGLAALAAMIPYYFGLYMLREKLKTGFQFEVKKQTF
jgi:sigma-E factor negative regulatory protein RseC